MEQLISPEEAHRQTFILHRGRLQPLPVGFQVMAPSRLGPMLTTSLLSWRGKLRVAAEAFRLRRSNEHGDDESVASLVKRHFGSEVYDRLVQPLITGIYGADPCQLSVRSTLPRFADMADRHRSLLRGMWAERRGTSTGVPGGSGRGGPFAAPRDGMSSFVQAIADQLPPDAIRLRAQVEEIVPTFDGGWRLLIGGEHREVIDVDGVVIATPVRPAVRLLAEIRPKAAQLLAQTRCTSSAVVSLGYGRDQIKHPLNGFGFVVPMTERRCILSCSFASQKYIGRSPEGAVLLRVFVGGGCQPMLLGLCDDELMELAHREIADLLGITGEPIMQHLVRHHAAMPQYEVGHQERLADVEHELGRFPTLALAGNAVCGVGIPSCIQSGQRAGAACGSGRLRAACESRSSCGLSLRR